MFSRHGCVWGGVKSEFIAHYLREQLGWIKSGIFLFWRISWGIICLQERDVFEGIPKVTDTELMLCIPVLKEIVFYGIQSEKRWTKKTVKMGICSTLFFFFFFKPSFLTKNRVCNYNFLVGYYLISCFTILPSLLIYLNLFKKLKGDWG